MNNYTNLDNLSPNKNFGDLMAKKYTGLNSRLRRLSDAISLSPKQLSALRNILLDLDAGIIPNADNKKLCENLGIKDREQLTELIELANKHKKDKYIGTAGMIMENQKSIWYVKAVDGEKYRIPEPEGGIDEILALDFKRVLA